MSKNISSTTRNLLGAAAVVVTLGLSGHAYALGESAPQTESEAPASHAATVLTMESFPAPAQDADCQTSVQALDGDQYALNLSKFWDWAIPRWRA